MEGNILRNSVYGPVTSRRLGCSLGVNILPLRAKVCNFDCLYCECGWNAAPYVPAQHTGWKSNANEILHVLEKRIEELVAAGTIPQIITFSGNGEPSLHPDFLQLVKGTTAIRDRLLPGVKVGIFSNSGMLDKPGVFEALQLADERFMKLDSAREETVRLINRPQAGYTVAKTIERLKRFGGDFTLQTLFFRGTFEGQLIDNTTPDELEGWFNVVDELKPQKVMVYTLDRKTPAKDLQKCPSETLHQIAAALEKRGIQVLLGE